MKIQMVIEDIPSYPGWYSYRMSGLDQEVAGLMETRDFVEKYIAEYIQDFIDATGEPQTEGETV